MDFTPILNSLTRLFPSSVSSPKSKQSLTVMILAPHPDDEAIVGSLPLRLAKENGAHVVAVAVTLGSKKERQEERQQEFTAACELLDFEAVELAEDWKKKEKELRSLIQKYQPQLILAPHLKDHHPTHIKTGELLKKVLLPLKKTTLLVAWTEFWGPLQKPNLLLEVPEDLLELQMRALEKHAGEVARNPYHLRLPAWMMDNVRRGSELIEGKGSEGASFAFGVLYRLQLWKNGKSIDAKAPAFLTAKDDAGQIFKLILDAAAGSKTKVK